MRASRPHSSPPAGRQPASPAESCPYDSCHALVEAGQRVNTLCKRDQSDPRLLRRDWPDGLALVGLEQALARRTEFDVIHVHLGVLALPVLRRSEGPVVMTVNTALPPETTGTLEQYPNIPLISRTPKAFVIADGLNWTGFVNIEDATRSMLAAMHLRIYRTLNTLTIRNGRRTSGWSQNAAVR